MNKDKMYKDNEYQITFCLNEFSNFLDTHPFHKDDMINIGRMALINAIDKFDPNRHCSPKTFIHTVIRRKYLTYIKKVIKEETAQADVFKACQREAMFAIEDCYFKGEEEEELIELAKESKIKKMDELVGLILMGYKTNEIESILEMHRKVQKEKLIRFGKYLKEKDYFTYEVEF